MGPARISRNSLLHIIGTHGICTDTPVTAVAASLAMSYLSFIKNQVLMILRFWSNESQETTMPQWDD
jgi:hypothetical protein